MIRNKGNTLLPETVNIVSKYYLIFIFIYGKQETLYGKVFFYFETLSRKKL